MTDPKTELYAALLHRGCYEVHKETARTEQLRLLGRVGQDRFQFFLPVMSVLWEASEDPNVPWTCDISKSYFKDDNGGFRYAWRLIFQSSGSPIASRYPGITQVVLSAARPERVEVTSVPLAGYDPTRIRGGQSSRGKGAAGVGQALIGPMAVARLNRGGQ